MHARFATQAARTPSAVAVVHRDAAITYEELARRVTVLARHLRTLGVARGARVALCVPRSSDFVAGALAILAAGAAYVPLDPDYPAQRLAFMLGDARASILLTNSTLQSNLPLFAGPVLCLDESFAMDGDDVPAFDDDIEPDDLAYIIYTSGSTGQPKGVMVRHASIDALVRETNYVSLRDRRHRRVRVERRLRRDDVRSLRRPAKRRTAGDPRPRRHVERGNVRACHRSASDHLCVRHDGTLQRDRRHRPARLSRHFAT